MTDDLRTRLRTAIASADGFDEDGLEPHDYQEHVDVVLAAVQPELDRLNQEIDYFKRNIRRSRHQVDGYDQELAVTKATLARMRALLDRGIDITWHELRDAYQGHDEQEQL
ncbi:hypothetical protein AB0O20_06600 [Streptomyces kronopolitis]|uniref:hypothetical protein n=1 Tax=Streptomyces kronopolitis TaxID=1612435 RepID=UPI00343C2781